MIFKPVVITFDSPNEFRRKDKLGISGLFDGEHYFVLKEEKNKTRFNHGEKFSGILVDIFGKTLEKTRSGFELMNAALKAECEKNSRPGLEIPDGCLYISTACRAVLFCLLVTWISQFLLSTHPRQTLFPPVKYTIPAPDPEH